MSRQPLDYPIPNAPQMPIAKAARMASAKARRAFWQGVVLGGLIVGATFIGGAAFAGESLFALYIGLSPPDGAPVTVYGGVLATQEICLMAGAGIETGIEAGVAGIEVTFACIPLPNGESA